MDFETIWYEYTPHIYAVAAAVAIFHIGSVAGIVAGVFLAGTSCVIFKKRRDYRKARAQRNDGYEERA